MPGRDEFVAMARTWVGVPWRRVGTRRDGVNCLGLLVGVARELGGLDSLVARAEPYANFARAPEHGDMLRRMKEYLRVVPRREAVPGDLPLFRIDGEPQHVTLLVAPDTVLHSGERAGGVREVRLVPPGWTLSIVLRIGELD